MAEVLVSFPLSGLCHDFILCLRDNVCSQLQTSLQWGICQVFLYAACDNIKTCFWDINYFLGITLITMSNGVELKKVELKTCIVVCVKQAHTPQDCISGLPMCLFDPNNLFHSDVNSLSIHHAPSGTYPPFLLSLLFSGFSVGEKKSERLSVTLTTVCRSNIKPLFLPFSYVPPYSQQSFSERVFQFIQYWIMFIPENTSYIYLEREEAKCPILALN